MALNTYEVKVTFRDHGRKDPAALRYLTYLVDAGKPRVAMARGMDRARMHKDCKDAWIVAAAARALPPVGADQPRGAYLQEEPKS